jgi:hypothetical protein
MEMVVKLFLSGNAKVREAMLSIEQQSGVDRAWLIKC